MAFGAGVTLCKTELSSQVENWSFVSLNYTFVSWMSESEYMK